MILTADGSRTLRSTAHGQTFKSRQGALTESRAVFVEGSGVAARLAAGIPTSVLEIGFGTGLNFLVTAEAARGAGTSLCYVAVESDLLPAATLRALAHHEALAPSPLPEALVEWRASLEDEEVAAASEARSAQASRRHRWRVAPVMLELVVGDVLDDGTWAALRPGAGHGLGSADGNGYDDGHDRGSDSACGSGPGSGSGSASSIASASNSGYDAVYHDAFSPAVSPELWSPSFLARLAAALAPGGRLVTFSVAGAVRRALAATGLEVRKVPGPPGGKAEVLVATCPQRHP